MSIFCIIPAYNEEKNIIKTIKDVTPFVDEIIVIDDCSSDDTYKLAKQTNAIVLKHPINRGQGAALQTGNEYAISNNADIIVHFDADGQFLAQEIKDIVSPIKENFADIVFGSRFLGKKSKMPFFKKNIIMPVASIINKILTKSTLSDPQNGFRAMTLDTAKIIKIKNDGMAHNSEIQQKAFKNNLKIKEVPITVIYNDFGQGIGGGKGRGTGGIKIIKDLILGRILE